MFQPNLGRWMQDDPIGFAGGDQNLYRAEGNQPTGRIDPSGLSWFSRRWDEVTTYGGAIVEGVGEGAENLAIGAGNMVVEVGQIARDTGNAAISLGSHGTDWAFDTGVYEFDLHSKTIGGYDVAVKSGTGNSYLLNAMADGGSLGVKPLVEGVIDFAETGDATNASQTAGGVAAGNLAGAGMAKFTPVVVRGGQSAWGQMQLSPPLDIAPAPSVPYPSAFQAARLTAAEAARDALGRELGRSHSAYSAGIDKYGNITTGHSQPAPGGGGMCAEDAVAGGTGPGGLFTKAMGWRRNPATGQLEWTEIPVCTRCQGKYSPGQFPPGTKADPGGRWGR